jgi:hypothetical protein
MQERKLKHKVSIDLINECVKESKFANEYNFSTKLKKSSAH